MKTVIRLDSETVLTIDSPDSATPPTATIGTPCACQFTGCKYVAPEVVELEAHEFVAPAPAPTAAEVAEAVVARLLGGRGIVAVDGAVIPDDLGVPPALQLGLPYQNYLIWAGRMGATWALQDPNVLLTLAAMLTAMAKAGDKPKDQLLAAAAARDALTKGV